MVSIRCWFASAALAGFVTLAAAPLPQALSTAGTAVAASKYDCMTDDGYGRKRSCSASYKAANPNWRGGDDCYTDDGYGRHRPCSASYKAKHQK
jgi:hypothetical protein